MKLIRGFLLFVCLFVCFSLRNVLIQTFAEHQEKMGLKKCQTYLLADFGPATRVLSRTEILSGNRWLILKGNSIIPVEDTGWTAKRVNEIKPAVVVELKVRCLLVS